MPGTRKRVSKKGSKPRSVSRTRRSSRTGKTTAKRTASRRVTRVSSRKEDVTHVYECTRPGCGYKIWLDEKGEPGQLRSDLKCPKCHHVEFRCLGKSDLPETFQVPVPTNTIDFDGVRTSAIGSN